MFAVRVPGRTEWCAVSGMLVRLAMGGFWVHAVRNTDAGGRDLSCLSAEAPAI